MTADSKVYFGGDGKISAVFNQNNIPETNEDINQLIASCSASKESLSKLYVMFKDSVFAVAFGITADYHLSEDCVAETFVRLAQVKHFSSVKGDGKGYILTVARNIALELRRKYKKDSTSIYIQNYGNSIETVENSIFINQLLSQLGDKQRQIVVLKCCCGLTFREIAGIMKSPESTVKSRYKKAMDILQEKAGADSE